MKEFHKSIFLAMIEAYQRTLSPDHGWFQIFYPHGFCRFYPTCSEYAARSIGRYGVARGSMKAFWRLLRCNPWNKGGFDPE